MFEQPNSLTNEDNGVSHISGEGAENAEEEDQDSGDIFEGQDLATRYRLKERIAQAIEEHGGEGSDDEEISNDDIEDYQVRQYNEEPSSDGVSDRYSPSTGDDDDDDDDAAAVSDTSTKSKSARRRQAKAKGKAEAQRKTTSQPKPTAKDKGKGRAAGERPNEAVAPENGVAPQDGKPRRGRMTKTMLTQARLAATLFNDVLRAIARDFGVSYDQVRRAANIDLKKKRKGSSFNGFQVWYNQRNKREDGGALFLTANSLYKHINYLAIVAIGEFTKAEVKIAWAEEKAKCADGVELEALEEKFRAYLEASQRQKTSDKVDAGYRAKIINAERGAFSGRVSGCFACVTAEVKNDTLPIVDSFMGFGGYCLVHDNIHRRFLGRECDGAERLCDGQWGDRKGVEPQQPARCRVYEGIDKGSPVSLPSELILDLTAD